MKKAWAEVFLPLIRRPSERQVAALCYRRRGEDKQVLLVTSSSGRWILPKGWLAKGMTAPAAAAREAWEEAGVRDGKIADAALGTYDYRKKLDNGAVAPVAMDVFPMKVKKLERDFPEADARKRKWVTTEQAASMVQEPGLQKILRDF